MAREQQREKTHRTAHLFCRSDRGKLSQEQDSSSLATAKMTFCKTENFRRLPSARFLVITYCVVGIILDLYFKYSPELPWTHMITGTSPSLELIVIGALLLDSPCGNKIAYYFCTLDVILGFLCLLTLPVISVAENATGHHLHLPFISSFHSNFKFQVNSTIELLYVTIFLGFVSTLLILLFLSLDMLKFVLLRRICHHDKEIVEKLDHQSQKV